MRKLICLSLLLICSQSCSAIVDGKLDDKKTSNTDEITIEVHPTEAELTIDDTLHLNIAVSENFTLVEPGYRGTADPAGYYKIFLGGAELDFLEDWVEEKAIPLLELFATWDGSPLGQHELRIALVSHDGSALDGEPSATVNLMIVEKRPQLCLPQENCDLCQFLGEKECQDKCLTQICSDSQGACIDIVELSTMTLSPQASVDITVEANRPLAHPEAFGPPTPTYRVEPYIAHPKLKQPISLAPFFTGHATMEMPSTVLELPIAPEIRALLKVDLVANSTNSKVAESCWPIILQLGSSDVDPKGQP